MKLIKPLLALAIYSLITPLKAENPFIFNDNNNLNYLGKHIIILEDEKNKLTATEAYNAKNYKKSENEVPNLNVSSSTFWLKFEIKNSSETGEIFLDISYPVLDEVALYQIEKGTPKLFSSLGDNKNFSNREYQHQDFIFQLKINPGDKQEYLLKVKSKEQILVPIRAAKEESLEATLRTKDMIFGIYFGIILVMSIYNFFIYFTVKDRSYLYYVLYIVFIGFTQASLEGYPYRFLWPDSPLFANKSLILFPAIGGSFAVLFLIKFGNTRIHFPKLTKVFYFFIGLYGIASLLSIFGFISLAYKFIDIIALPLSLYMLFIAIKVANKGYRPAKFFLAAWTIFLVGVFIFVLRNFGILPYNNFTNYIMEAGTAIEVSLLSIALADRIKILQKDKEESQKRELEALQENERIIREQNIILEKEVAARTADLKEANSELENTLNELKNTQAQLVDSEKMASLGQLTAGIAHEINNPINFVVSNVSPLKRDLQDLFEVINKYREVEDDTKKIEEAIKLRKDLDADFLKEEIEMLLNGIEEGASRTAEIVKGLKVFARLDEGGVKGVDINEGIDSTLMLIGNDLDKRGITVEKHLNCDQKVECDSGKMNQVFMNILTNAMQAIESDPNKEKKGTIFIETRIDNSDVYIIFKDNGPGIDDEYKSKVFDPFFTTKDVGEGTGLGLSIVINIIKSHNGTIQLNSEKGKGTEFIIKIPQKQA